MSGLSCIRCNRADVALRVLGTIELDAVAALVRVCQNCVIDVALQFPAPATGGPRVERRQSVALTRRRAPRSGDGAGRRWTDFPAAPE